MDSAPQPAAFVAAWTLSGKHRARVFSVDPHVHNCCCLESILLHHRSATAQRVKPWLRIGADERLRAFEQPWAAPTHPYRASASPRCARAALWAAQRCCYPRAADERNRTWDGSGIPPAPSVAPCTRALPARHLLALRHASPCTTRSRTRCHSSAYALQQ